MARLVAKTLLRRLNILLTIVLLIAGITPLAYPFVRAQSPPEDQDIHVFSGNIAPQAYVHPTGTGALVDRDLNTEWVGGHGNASTVYLSWAAPVAVHRMVVWDRAAGTSGINSLTLMFSDGTAATNIDMTSAGPRCADITFPEKTVTWVGVVPWDSSGDNGYREIEVWATVGEQYSDNTCVMSRSVMPVPASVSPPPVVATPIPGSTPVPYTDLVVSTVASESSDGQAHDASNPYLIPLDTQNGNVIIKASAYASAPGWNGSSGGIVRFTAAGTVRIDGVLTVNGKGYRGGPEVVGASDGRQGESYTGLGSKSTAANGGGGGGGAGADSGGGGGGYGSAGQNAQNGPDIPPAYGGNTYGDEALTTLYLGSGGGSSGAQSSNFGGAGGAGGGIIHIQANRIVVTGRISANGTDGLSAGTPADPRGGGGGSGGSMLLHANILELGNNLVTALGGQGGYGIRSNTNLPAAGGAGGVGRIRIEYCNMLSGTTNPPASVEHLSCQAPPTVDAEGPYTGYEGANIPLSPTASDPDGDILTYAWTVDSSLCTFSDATALNPTITCRDNGNYTATLTVSDGVNDPVSATATVTVNNVAPAVTLTGITIINEGDTSSYSYTVSDPGAADTFTLDTTTCGVGGTLSNSTFAGATGAGSFDCTFRDGTTSTEVSVTVSDDEGDSGSDSLTVTVNNVAPSLTVDNATVTVDEGHTANNTGIFSDPGDDIVSITASIGTVQQIGSQSGTWSWAFNTSDGPDQSQQVTITATDSDGGSTTITFQLTVNNVAPTIALSGSASVNEGSEYALTLGAVTDPGDDTVTQYIVQWGDGDTDTYANVGDITHIYADGDAAPTITVDLVDEDGTHAEAGSLVITVDNVAPIVGAITAPVDPVQVNLEISASTDFADPAGTVDAPYTVDFDWGNGMISTLQVNVPSLVSASYSYSTAGVYTIKVTATDKDGDSGESIFQFVAVYDPIAGFVTGAGWINSPAGAYTPDSSLTGMARFGFVSRYEKGATTPSGRTQFMFRVAELDFHSTSYDWLVVAGHKAMYKGVGTINGSGNYGFLLSAIDEQLTPSTDIDLFRIKIWDKNNGDAIVYDNQVACADNADDADPCTAIEGGNIVIHTGKGGANAAGVAQDASAGNASTIFLPLISR